MYAIIETGGKQYRVQEGDVLEVEKLNVEPDTVVEFNEVLAVAKDDGLQVGTPFVDGAKVQAKVIEHGKGQKIIVFKYKPKKNYRKRKGHRQQFTRVEIQKILA